MFRIDWRNGLATGIAVGGFIAIISIVWIIGLNYCPQTPCYQYDGYSEQPANDKDWLPNSVGPDITSDPHPADQDDHPKYYEHQDLAAQEIMADATEWIVKLTAISLAIGVVGAGAIIWTLLESRKVSSAAIETNKIMRNEQRPWVFLEAEECCELEVSATWIYLKWFGGLINRGKMPAYSVASDMTVVCSEHSYLHPSVRDSFARSFVKECQKKISGTIIFSQEPPVTHRKRIKARHDGSDGVFFLLHAVGYCLEGSHDSELGFEIKCFELEFNPDFDPEFTIQRLLKEVPSLRMAT